MVRSFIINTFAYNNIAECNYYLSPPTPSIFSCLHFIQTHDTHFFHHIFPESTFADNILITILHLYNQLLRLSISTSSLCIIIYSIILLLSTIKLVSTNINNYTENLLRLLNMSSTTYSSSPVSITYHIHESLFRRKVVFSFQKLF